MLNKPNNTHMKKLIIALSITLFSMSIAFAGTVGNSITNNHSFSDITSADVAVLYLAEKGIIKGRPNGTIDKNGPLNRAESLTMFARVFELDAIYDPNCTFPDVPADAWYAPYVSAMCNAKMVSGYPDGTFRATNQLNKAEAMKILVEGLNLNLETSLENLPPDVNADAWYAKYASYVFEKNIAAFINGKFNGSDAYTRGDLFTNLYRLMRLQELEEDTYSSSLDPQVVDTGAEETTNIKSNQKYLTTVGNDVEATEFFKFYDADFSNFLAPPKSMTYRQAAAHLGYQYLDSIFGRVPADLSDKVFQVILSEKATSDIYDKDFITFYDTFGLNITNKDLDSKISQTELDSLIKGIVNHAKTFTNPMEAVEIGFKVTSPTTIELTFNERGCGINEGLEYTSRDYINENYLYSESGKEFGIKVAENNSTNEINFVKYGQRFDENGVTVDLESEGWYGLVNKGFAKITMELESPLDASKDYTLHLNPILFHRYAKGGTDYYNCNLFTEEYLVQSSIAFKGNSDFKFTYNLGKNSKITGIVASSVVTWTPGWTLPLSAVLYDENGELVSKSKGFTWSVVKGKGTISTKSGGSEYLSSTEDNEVIIKVKYGNLEDTLEIDFSGKGGV